MDAKEVRGRFSLSHSVQLDVLIDAVALISGADQVQAGNMANAGLDGTIERAQLLPMQSGDVVVSGAEQN